MALRRLEDQVGRRLGDIHRPAAGLRAVGGEVLDAGDDGDGPQRRAQRLLRAGPRRGLAGRAVRLGLLPAADPDVRQDRARHRGRAFRGGAGRGEGRGAGSPPTSSWTPADLRELVDTFNGIVAEHTGRDFPQDPREQLDMAMRAVFDSWNTERARLYRRRERIPQDLGTAVNVCTMVFGNLGETSGTGVCFTRDPATGQPGVYGDYLVNAQGEDVVAGIRNTLTLDDFARLDPASHSELTRIMRRLETHYRDLCDIEFTVERGKLWMLQTRVGKRTAAAAFRIATQLVDERLITLDEALARVTGPQLGQLMFPQFDAGGRAHAADPGHGGLAGRGRRQGGLRLRRPRSSGRRAGSVVLLCRRRPTPTTWRA